MPTVPSTCVSVDSLVSVPLTNPDLLGSDENVAGPTPDPDTDDLVLVPADVGNAVSQDSLESTPPQPIVKPRLELGSIVLHSPSSIVGTPFDPSPRFEYPFPAPGCPPQFGHYLDHDLPPNATMSSPLTMFPSVAPPLSSVPIIPSIGGAVSTKQRSEIRSFSPTHIKLNPRDPPVPPGLVKRRLNRNGTGDSAVVASALDASQERPRGDILSSLSDKLEQLNMETRGREHSVDARRANDRSWSPSQNAKWKRNSLALGEPARRSRTPDPHSKLYFSQNNSSPALAHEVFGYNGYSPASPTPRASAAMSS